MHKPFIFHGYLRNAHGISGEDSFENDVFRINCYRYGGSPVNSLHCDGRYTEAKLRASRARVVCAMYTAVGLISSHRTNPVRRPQLGRTSGCVV